MSFDTRAGTRGLPMEGSRLDVWMDRQMARRGIRKVFALFGFDVAILTTIGHRSGTQRRSQVCWFPGGDGSWLIVAAAGGTRVNPAWYYNIAAHPDEVQLEIDGRNMQVTAEQLHGAERAQAWQHITAAAHRFAGFQDKTDREFPILRLTPRHGSTARYDSGHERRPIRATSSGRATRWRSPRHLTATTRQPKPVVGKDAHGMAFISWGTGEKKVLWIVGGPGLGFPIGLRVAVLPWLLRPFPGCSARSLRPDTPARW